MHSYASWTGTRRNLRAMRGAGWRLLMSPDTWDRCHTPVPAWADGTPAPYALDNGAWGAFSQGKPWDAGRFADTYDALGAGADWTVIPDIVAGGLDSLRVSAEWIPRLSGRLLLAVQDGMTAAAVRPLLCPRVGLFLGGSTEWKIRTMATWGRLAAEAGCWYHVGRVNTARRISMAGASGAHSFDGTSATRFAVNVPPLDAARRRFTLFHQEGPWAL